MMSRVLSERLLQSNPNNIESLSSDIGNILGFQIIKETFLMIVREQNFGLSEVLQF
jgi:hypothetical protein